MGSLIYADATHIREQAKIDAARITQKSGNQRRGAETALQQFSASLANHRAMEAAGDRANAITSNIARNLDATTFGNFMGRVRAAEELGANIAMASAAGVGGSTVEAYNATLRLNQSMQEEQADRASAADLFNASESRGASITEAVAGLDNNVYRANLDYTQYVDHKKLGGLERLFWIGTAAAATYFGGPQAGAAVVGMAEGKQAAINGDFETASRAQMGALTNGLSAGHDVHKLGGSYWKRKAPTSRERI